MISIRRFVAVAFVLVLIAGVSGFSPWSSSQAQDAAAPDPGAEALKKAVETGQTLFHSAEFGTNGRACAKCHENPRKPDMNLKKRVGDYPKWDRREGKVITLGQKINQMLQKMVKGQAEPLGSEKLVAVEAYLMSLSRQAD